MPPARDEDALGVAVLDYDGDGRPDLYFVNDRVSNRLFRNRGDGRFEETTAETGAGVLGDRPRAGMGVAVGDPFGAEPRLLFVTNFGGEENSLYRNVEGALFEDARRGDGRRDGRVALRAVGHALRRLRQRRLARPLRGRRAPGARASSACSGTTGAAVRSTSRRAIGRSRRRPCCCTTWAAGASSSGRTRAISGRAADGRAGQRRGGRRRRRRPRPLRRRHRRARRAFRGTRPRAGTGSTIEPLPGPDGRTVLGTRVRVTAGGRTQTQTWRVSPSYASGSVPPLHFGLGEARDRRRRGHLARGRAPDLRSGCGGAPTRSGRGARSRV